MKEENSNNFSHNINHSLQLKKNESKQNKSNSFVGSQNLTQFSDEVIQTFNLMNQTIQNLDQKIDNVLRNHQAQFLFAWRSHIKKIKIQLQQIRDKTDQKQKNMNSNQKLVSMEKQMTIFREQSLKLYEELEQKKAQLQICKKKLREQKQNNLTLQQENKQLIKVSKMAEAKSNIYLQQIKEYQQKQMSSRLRDNRTQNQKCDENNDFSRSKMKNTKTLYLQSATKSKTKTIPALINRNNKTVSIGIQNKKKQAQEDQIYDKSEKYKKFNNRFYNKKKWQTSQVNINADQNAKHFIFQENISNQNKGSSKEQINVNVNMLNNYHTHISVPRKRFSLQRQVASKIVFSPQIYDSQIKEWFIQCIKSVRKQISSRKTSNFSTSTLAVLRSNSLEEFKTIDKLRLLEMFLQNEKLIVYMYQKIFPDRINQIQAYLTTKNQNINLNSTEGHKNQTQQKSSKIKVTEIVDEQMLQALQKHNQQRQKEEIQNLNSKKQWKSREKAKSLKNNIGNVAYLKSGKLQLG